MTGDDKAAAGEKTELADGKKEMVPAPTEYKFAVRPEVKTGLDGVLSFLWNPETGEVMGRTGMSWLKITVFYIIYYTCLAGFFILCLSVFLAFLNDQSPMWENENSIIGSNPGLGYRPHPPDSKIESTLIWYRHGTVNGDWNKTDGWVDRLEKDLQNYHNDTYQANVVGGRMFVGCGEQGSVTAGPEQLCKVGAAELFAGRCTPDQGYGYPAGKPCIMIKLNKIYGWSPTPFDNETQMIERGVPEGIIQQFRKNLADGKPELNNRVWLDCHGENPGDRENLGPVHYHPGRGFSANYYPYENQAGYLSPVVFAQLEDPKWGVMIAIECRAWDQKIQHNSQDRIGVVHFELMID